MNPKTKKVSIIIVGLAVIIAGAGFWVWEKNLTSEKQKTAQEEHINELQDIERRARIDNARGIATPEGVMVSPQGENLFVKNEREGYEIAVPNTWVIADSGDSSLLNFYDKEGYGSDYYGYVYMSIKTSLNKESLSLDEWIDGFGNLKKTDKREKFDVGGMEGYKIVSTAFIDSDDYDPVTEKIFTKKIEQTSHKYYFLSNTKIYEISAFVEDNIGSEKYNDDPIIQTFKVK